VPAPRVLVVDDDPIQRELVSDILAGEGYAVETAGSGEAGLEAARTAPPDVIVLDLFLPGMDGASVVRELRRDARLSDVRVIVTTGVRDAHVKRLLKPDAILFKPFGIEELLLAVAGVVTPAGTI
jgi:CheY-like chemotaxis protein